MAPLIVKEKKPLLTILLFVAFALLSTLLLLLINYIAPLSQLFDGSLSLGQVIELTIETRALKGIIIISIIILAGVLGLGFVVYKAIKTIFNKDLIVLRGDEHGIYFYKFKIHINWNEITNVERVGNAILIQVLNYDKVIKDASSFTKKILQRNADVYSHHLPGNKVCFNLFLILHDTSAEEVFQKIKEKLNLKALAE